VKWSACPCDASARRVVFTPRLPNLPAPPETPAPSFVPRARQRRRVGYNQDRDKREPSTTGMAGDVAELPIEVHA
jgi:hypothetical protein